MLSADTASTVCPSRLAFCSSRKRMRSVAMRLGTMMFDVMLVAATSRASVFDHPTNDRRNAFNGPRLGMGRYPPEEVLVTSRPYFALRMFGSTRSVILMTESTIILKNLCQALALWPDTDVCGGLPAKLTRISTAPNVLSLSPICRSIEEMSARSQTIPCATPPAAVIASLEAATAAGSLCFAPS